MTRMQVTCMELILFSISSDKARYVNAGTPRRINHRLVWDSSQQASAKPLSLFVFSGSADFAHCRTAKATISKC